MQTAVFILAAGDAERHNGGNKPLLEVEGDTLLNRMAIQVRRQTAGVDCFVVTHRPENYHPACYTLKPKERDFISATLLSTAPEWKERNIILLGDVYYTDDVMQEILAEDRPLVFFGDNTDIFAMVFHIERKVEAPLRTFVDEVRKHPAQFGFGKLGAFFKFIGPHRHFVRVTDKTCDFDSPQDVERFNRGEFKHAGNKA